MNILSGLKARRDRAIRLAAEAILRGDKDAAKKFCDEGNYWIKLISESCEDEMEAAQ